MNLSFYTSSFILFVAMSLLACKQQAQDQDSRSTNVVTASAPAPKPVLTTDSIKPKRRRYIVESSRSPDKVNKEFPYDIDLKTTEGKIIKSSELLQNDGKPVVLCFWLTTCYPCRLELKAINEVYPQWEKETGVKLVAISTDFKKNYDNFVKRVNESNWSFEAYNDVNREFRYAMPGALNGLPQTFLLDGEGNIVYHKRKYRSGDEHALFEKIKELTNQ